MTVIAISGTQGSGKTTVLNELQKNGYAIDTYKVSRAVQEELKSQALTEVTGSFEVMKQYQELVFKRKYERDMSLKNTGGLILTERSFIDIAAYASLWLAKIIDSGEQVDTEWGLAFTRKCKDAQLEVYGGAVMIPLLPGIQHEQDPKRASYNDSDAFYRICTGFISIMLGPTFPIYTVYETSIPNRIESIQHFLTRF